MGGFYRDARVDVLRRAQNSDGGWGYFPGKQSWLEPTAWAALALHGTPESDRAWSLLKTWQLGDGSWRPGADVQISNWGTALCVTLACVRRDYGDPFHKGVNWLLGISGNESAMWRRALASTGLFPYDRNPAYKGWPWKPNTASWVEPTAHALVALKKASAHFGGDELQQRIRLGHAQLRDVRCADGGWNYGSHAALGIDLPSYPETTALALLGLQGETDLDKSLATARHMMESNPSPLALAWLRIALSLHGESVPELFGNPSSDVMITSIEVLSCENYKLLRTGGRL